MSDKNRDNAVEETVEEVFTDPDAPDNSRTSPPPQTIDAEPDDAR